MVSPAIRCLNPTVATGTHLTMEVPGANPSRMSAPLIAWTLIAAILIGGLPILSRIVASAVSKPVFTLDVCHPINGVSYNLSQSEAPLIPGHTAAQLPEYSGTAFHLVSVFSPRRVSDPPDPPPPKIGA
jgi:hypothetical protein